MIRILLVGGVFDNVGGRASGYISKLYVDMRDVMYSAVKPIRGYEVQCMNGGNLSELEEFVSKSNYYDCIIWMVDIDNGVKKFLPKLLENSVGKLVIRSKMNGGRYEAQELYGMLSTMGIEYLVEFNRGEAGISSRLLGIGGSCLWEGFDIDELAYWLVYHIVKVHFGRVSPLYVMDERDVHVGDHAGAFGYVRKHHCHEGVDLYCAPRTEVFAMERGLVVGVHQFTGTGVGSPWWNDTKCVMVQGLNGVICYGEIEPRVEYGDVVGECTVIGHVKTVLKKDKGLPMTMLHLERYVNGTTKPVLEWGPDMDKPAHLLDPTCMLLGSVRCVR